MAAHALLLRIRVLQVRFRTGLLGLSLMVVLALCTARADDGGIEAAKAAAEVWLAAADRGDAALTWRMAATLFQQAVSVERWQQALDSVRGPLGVVRSRQLIAAKPARSLPNAPDGEYVVIQYRTVFEHRAEATETITPMRGSDGQWHVAGYYVR